MATEKQTVYKYTIPAFSFISPIDLSNLNADQIIAFFSKLLKKYGDDLIKKGKIVEVADIEIDFSAAKSFAETTTPPKESKTTTFLKQMTIPEMILSYFDSREAGTSSEIAEWCEETYHPNVELAEIEFQIMLASQRNELEWFLDSYKKAEKIAS